MSSPDINTEDFMAAVDYLRSLELPVPEDAPFFVKDYSEYYKGRCYHKRSLNSIFFQ